MPNEITNQEPKDAISEVRNNEQEKLEEESSSISNGDTDIALSNADVVAAVYTNVSSTKSFDIK